jgi:hypothetical protein
MQAELAYLVSNIDLQKKFKSQSRLMKIMVYPDLAQTNNILDILPEDKCVVFILLRTSENSGHWTCVCRNGQSIYYFDSYGVDPDGELSHISSGLRYELHENVKSLTRLISTIPDGFTFSYNHTQFQEYSPSVNTCGKWCYAFSKCIISGLTLDQFQLRMKQMKQQYRVTYDELVCNLWKTL